MNAGFNYWIGQNNAVTFNNTSSGVSSGVTYTWNFGDGNSAIGSQPTHTYATNGIYNVTLTANNNYTSACVSVYTANVNANTACNFSANITSSLLPNGVVSISSKTTGTNPPNMYYWQFGDGTSSNGSGLSAVQHTYYINGTFPVNLWLSSITPSCNINYTAGITVTNVISPPCTLQANFNFSTGSNGALSFLNTSTGTLASTSYLWDFGLGTPWLTNSTANSPNYLYTNNQNYLVKLTATNNFSPACISTKTAIVTISNTTCNLVASIQHTQMPNGVVSFTNTTSGGGGWNNYFWAFGDGNVNSSTVTAVTQHTYAANGSYQVYGALLSTVPACTAVAWQTINVSTSSVTPCNLVPSFSFSPIGPGQFQFYSTSSGTTNSTTYQWNFGNGITSSSNPATVSYPSNGQYTNLLNVNNNSVPACSANINQTLSVTNSSCIANSGFTMAPTNTAQVWYAVPAFPWNVSNAIWNWGDGSSSNGLFVSHTYSAAGMYNICLSVSVNCGSTASTCASYSVFRSANPFIQVNVVDPSQLTDLTEVQQAEIEIVLYPNPGDGLFYLESTALSGDVNIRVLDLRGKTISNLNLNKEVQGNYRLDLRTLPNGIYLMELQQTGQLLHKKLIITKD